MDLVRFDPFSLLSEMDRLFERASLPPRPGPPASTPSIARRNS